MADVLPGYAYSRTTSRYRNLSSGRFVSRQDIMGLLQAQTQGLESRLGALTQALQDGDLAPAYWAEQVRTELRRTHLQQRALGAGGWDRLSASDYGSAGRRLRDDYARIANLAQGIVDGSASIPQALTRLSGYAGAARIEFWEAERQRMQAPNGETVIMIRDLGIAEHCESCVEYHGRGWALDLPEPGTESECRERCRCTMRYRTVTVGSVEEWLGTRRAG